MNAHIDPNLAHATYAPSSAHRWTVCTASATAIAHLGEQEEGEEAAKGTAAHDEIERVLSGEGIDPDHPAAYGVALLLDYVRQLPPGRLWVEQRVHLTDQIWGRCDVAHFDEASGTLTIVDYKNGYVGVDADENEQLRIYAAGSIYTHKLPAKWIRYAIVQPNDFRPVPRVKQWMEDASSLFAFAERTAAIPLGPLKFVAGEQCTYCPLFGRCDASKDVLTQLQIMLANPPDQVPAHQVALFTAVQKPVLDWFKALDKSATRKAMAGTVPPGMKLVQTTKHKAWTSEAEARALVLNTLGADALDVPTPAQAIERGIPEAVVNKMAPRPDGGPALAFASDKRPVWAPKTSAQMFAGLTEAMR